MNALVLLHPLVVAIHARSTCEEQSANHGTGDRQTINFYGVHPQKINAVFERLLFHQAG